MYVGMYVYIYIIIQNVWSTNNVLKFVDPNTQNTKFSKVSILSLSLSLSLSL